MEAPMFDAEGIEEAPFCDSIHSTVRGALWRVALTVVVPAAWISATILFLAFFAHGLSAFQEIAVLVSSGLLLVAAVAAMWVTFGLRMYRRWVEW
jgi:hypothetical protein